MKRFQFHNFFRAFCILSAVLPVIVGVVGIAYPYGFPLFSIVVLLMGAVCLVNFVFSSKISLDKKFLLILFLEFLYIIAVFRLGNMIDPVSNNLRKILFVNLYFIFLYSFNFNYKEVLKYIDYIRKFTILAAVSISILGIQKFQLLLNGIQVEKYLKGERYPWGTSLVIDYNMFSFVLLSAIIFILFYFYKAKSLALKFLYLACSGIVLPCIIFSGSRRAIVLLVVILAVGLLAILAYRISILNFLKGKYKTNYVKNVFTILFLSFIIAFAFGRAEGIIDVESYQFTRLIDRMETLIDGGGDNFGALDERTKRWQFAQVLVEQSDVFEFFFGRGLDYLELFGALSISNYDHPHNIFIAHFFFSGFIGVIILVAFFIVSGWLYLKHIKLLLPEFVIFLVTILYYSISSDVLFSARPFFIHILLSFYFSFIFRKYNQKLIS